MATSNALSGLGNSAFGGADFGFGTASPAVVPAPSAETFARQVDPITGDYALTAAGDGFQTYSRVTQQVALALTTRKGSIPSDPGFGITWPEKITDSFEQDVDGSTRAAVSHIVGLDILEVRVSLSAAVAGRFNVLVRFRDATGAEDTVQLDGSRS